MSFAALFPPGPADLIRRADLGRRAPHARPRSAERTGSPKRQRRRASHPRRALALEMLPEPQVASPVVGAGMPPALSSDMTRQNNIPGTDDNYSIEPAGTDDNYSIGPAGTDDNYSIR